MPDPSMLVTVPTIDDPALAPPGRSTLYVLEPVPNLTARVDWTTDREQSRERAGRRRWPAAGYPPDVESSSTLVDPLDWAAAGHGRRHPVRARAHVPPDRAVPPGQRRRRAPGLVFVGSGTVPGVGVPMVLISGRLAAERVDELP